MKRQQLWEQLEDASIRLREASLAAAAATGVVEISAAYARWALADGDFKEVVDKLRRLRERAQRSAG